MDPFQAVQSRPRALVVVEAPKHGAGGIVNVPQKHTGWAPALEPGVVGAVQLDQLAAMGFPLPPLAMGSRLALLVRNARRLQPEPQRLRVEADPVALAQFLAGMDEIEIVVLLLEQREHPGLDLPRHPVVRGLAPRAVTDPSIAFDPYPLEQPPDLPVTQVEQAGGCSLGHLLLQCLMQDVESRYFPSAHREYVLFRHNAVPLSASIVAGHRTFLFWRNRTLSFWDYRRAGSARAATGAVGALIGWARWVQAAPVSSEKELLGCL